MEISEVVGYVDREIILNPLYVFVEEDSSIDINVIGELKRTNNKMKNKSKFRTAGIFKY